MDKARKASEESAKSKGGKQAEAPASAAKPKAEANPLVSKLGLSASAPRVAMPAAMLQRQQGRGRGRGRGPFGGRGAKAVVPGRGGRPRYSPLMQASSARMAQP